MNLKMFGMQKAGENKSFSFRARSKMFSSIFKGLLKKVFMAFFNRFFAKKSMALQRCKKLVSLWKNLAEREKMLYTNSINVIINKKQNKEIMGWKNINV